MLMVRSRTILIINYCFYISEVFSNEAAEKRYSRNTESSYIKREKVTSDNDRVATQVLINHSKAI